MSVCHLTLSLTSDQNIHLLFLSEQDSERNWDMPSNKALFLCPKGRWMLWNKREHFCLLNTCIHIGFMPCPWMEDATISFYCHLSHKHKNKKGFRPILLSWAISNIFSIKCFLWIQAQIVHIRFAQLSGQHCWLKKEKFNGRQNKLCVMVSNKWLWSELLFLTVFVILKYYFLDP